MAGRRRALSHDLIVFVDLKTRQLQVLYDPLGKHLPGIVRRVLLEEPAQEIPAPGDRKADREGELRAEGAVIHGRAFLFCSSPQTSRRAGLVVKTQRRHPFSAEPDAGRTPPDAALTVPSLLLRPIPATRPFSPRQ